MFLRYFCDASSVLLWASSVLLWCFFCSSVMFLRFFCDASSVLLWRFIGSSVMFLPFFGNVPSVLWCFFGSSVMFLSFFCDLLWCFFGSSVMFCGSSGMYLWCFFGSVISPWFCDVASGSLLFLRFFRDLLWSSSILLWCFFGSSVGVSVMFFRFGSPSYRIGAAEHYQESKRLHGQCRHYRNSRGFCRLNVKLATLSISVLSLYPTFPFFCCCFFVTRCFRSDCLSSVFFSFLNTSLD